MNSSRAAEGRGFGVLFTYQCSLVLPGHQWNAVGDLKTNPNTLRECLITVTKAKAWQ